MFPQYTVMQYSIAKVSTASGRFNLSLQRSQCSVQPRRASSQESFSRWGMSSCGQHAGYAAVRVPRYTQIVWQLLPWWAVCYGTSAPERKPGAICRRLCMHSTGQRGPNGCHNCCVKRCPVPIHSAAAEQDQPHESRLRLNTCLTPLLRCH